MKKMVRLIVLAVVFCFVSCNKGNHILQVSGTINGEPALTLYGASNRAADYILLSKDPSIKEMVYDGVTFSYNSDPSSTGVVIDLSSSMVIRGTLTTTGSKTILVIDTLNTSIFGSETYASY